MTTDQLTTFIPGESTSDDVAAQKLLASLGYYKGDIDGQFYSQSKDALRRYLTDHHPTAAPNPDHENNLADAIFAASKPDVGLYEVQDNTVWAMQGTGDRAQGVVFRANLEKEGWQPPESYCAAAVKSWYHRGYVAAGRDFTAMSHVLTLGCVETYQNAVRAGITTNSPAPGDIGVMQHGNSGLGHMWIVRSVGNGIVYTREANTSPAPTDDPNVDRNGGCVTDKSRVLVIKPTSGLHIIGFIRCPV